MEINALITSEGCINTNDEAQRRYVQNKLDERRVSEGQLVYMLWEMGNYLLALAHHEKVNDIVIEQMKIKYVS